MKATQPRRLLALLLLVGSLLPANLLRNSDFESGSDTVLPAWEACDFGTGGDCLVGQGDDARSGRRYARLRSTDAERREAWRQRVRLPEQTAFVVVRASYRTRDTAPDSHRGASLRLHWFDAAGKEIGLEQRFFAPSADWRDTGPLHFVRPEAAQDAQLQLFHWLTPGETHWDDASLTVLRRDELEQLPAEVRQQLSGLDLPPLDMRRLPYHPADGDAVAINPPPFRWAPISPTTRHTLQVCRRPDFTGDSLIVRDGLPWGVEVLERPLAAGDWHWRVGYRHPQLGQLWSRARRFTVPAGVREWPFPADWRSAIRRETPRLFFPPERLAELRRRTAPGGDLHGFAAGRVAEVRRWAGEPLVEEPDWLPKGKDRGRVYTEVFRRTRPPMNRMENAALAFLLTGDEGCGQEARRRVLHFFSWDPNGPTNTFHNDEPAMWIMMRGCRAYDWTRQLYSPEERQRVERCIVTRAKAIYDLLRRRNYENNPFESHLGRQIGFLGEACLALLPEHPEMATWFEYILKIYWGVYPAWGHYDGGWNEGPHYWSYYMEFGLHFIIALRNATGIDLIRKPFFAATPYHFLYLCPPQSVLSPFGDGDQARPLRLPRLLSVFGRLLDDPILLWYARQHGYSPNRGTSLLELALPPTDIQPQPPDSLPPARLFPAVGLVASNTRLDAGDDNISLLFRSSPYGAVSHGHNDQNCFTLAAFGEPLAIPSGHYEFYSSPHHDRWTRQTKAKCGITFDGGQGQKRGAAAKGHITQFLQTPDALAFTGDATAAYGGQLTQAIRQVVRIMPDLIVIRDSLASETPRSFEFCLHATDAMTLDEQARTVIIRRPKARLTTTFLAPQPLTFTQTAAFDPPPNVLPSAKFVDQFHFRAASQPARQATFVSVLHPQRSTDQTPTPTLALTENDSAQLVTATLHDRTRLLIAFNRTPGQPARIAGLDFTGALTALRIAPDGKAATLLLAP
ncbi:MAG: DUF4962 domain-containing protein [Oligosphaeraceae bacterium]